MECELTFKITSQLTVVAVGLTLLQTTKLMNTLLYTLPAHCTWCAACWWGSLCSLPLSFLALIYIHLCSLPVYVSIFVFFYLLIHSSCQPLYFLAAKFQDRRWRRPAPWFWKAATGNGDGWLPSCHQEAVSDLANVQYSLCNAGNAHSILTAIIRSKCFSTQSWK